MLAGFILLFLSDNILWYAAMLKSKESHETIRHISKDTQQILSWLGHHTTSNDLLVSNEYMVSYMSNAYASSYSWAGHVYNTPDFTLKQRQALEFLKTGIPLPEWKERHLLILINKNQADVPVAMELKKTRLFENKTYVIYVF